MNSIVFSQKLRAAFFHGGSAYGIGRLLSFGIKVLVSQCGPSAIGIYYFSTELMRNTSQLASWGIPMSMGRFIGLYSKESEKQVHAIQSSITLLMVLCVVALIGIAFTFPHLVPHAYPLQQNLAFIMLAVGIIGNMLLLHTKAVAFGYVDSKTAYIYEGLDAIIKVLCIGIGLYSTHTIVGALYGYSIGSMLSGVMCFVHMSHSHRVPFRLRIDSSLFSYAWPVGVSEAITASISLYLLFLLSRVAGASSLGIIATGMSVAVLVFFVPQVALPIVVPSLSQALTDRGIPKKILLAVFRFVAIPTLGVAIVLVLTTPVLYPYIFGHSFTQGIQTTQLLIVAHAIYAIGVWIPRQLLDSLGLTRQNLLVTIVRSSAMLVIGYVSMKSLGSLGFAISLVAGWGIECGILSLVIWHKRTNLID